MVVLVLFAGLRCLLGFWGLCCISKFCGCLLFCGFGMVGSCWLGVVFVRVWWYFVILLFPLSLYGLANSLVNSVHCCYLLQ